MIDASALLPPRILALLAALLFLAPLAPAARAQTGERILDYDIGIDVRADGSLDIAEHITVHAERNQIRRGIYRDFPTRYRDRYGNDVVVDLDVIGVERDGAPEPWFTERLPNGVRINTGGDDFLPRFPEEYRYTIRYRTSRQLGFFDDHDELYWNAIGTGWVFAIEDAAVEVRLPEPVPVERMQAEGYTGAQGARGQAYRASIVAPGVARWELTEPLAPREGFTIVLSFPKGVVAQPTAGDRAAWLLADNRGVLVALAGFALLLLYSLKRWRRVGRDPRAGVIIARYEPPEDRSPAELRYLARRRYDMRCFTSDLLTSAVEGHVEIEREPRVLLGDRWRLTRTGGAGAGERFPTVSALIERLFPGGNGDLELDKKNASRLQRARQAHAKALSRRLHGSHFKRNAGSIVVAVAIAAVTGFLAFAISGGGGVPAIAALCVLMGIVVIAVAYLVQAPTAAGRELLDETEGLKLYLSVAERDELAGMEGPGGEPPLDARRYETLLPYAVALDVEEAWTRKFTAAVGAAAAAAAASQIAWYHGGRVGDLGGLTKAVGSGLSSSIASAATPPGSTSGSGGGGFSGGGGGGGGGGGR
ncbi:MAG: DUF2207 domain-containing protein [Gammaproteobacteria bacterium]|nr:DUF2207 domain-containing protein [Gammaproteobacteria bacterium]